MACIPGPDFPHLVINKTEAEFDEKAMEHAANSIVVRKSCGDTIAFKVQYDRVVDQGIIISVADGSVLMSLTLASS